MAAVYIVYALQSDEEGTYANNIKAFKDETKAGLYVLELMEKLADYAKVWQDWSDKRYSCAVDRKVFEEPCPTSLDKYKEIFKWYGNTFHVEALEFDDEELPEQPGVHMTTATLELLPGQAKRATPLFPTEGAYEEFCARFAEEVRPALEAR